MNKDLELRMYFFVPYNISPIQQAIQAGHAAQQYDFNYRDNLQLIDFITNWKTWIILNGGTTNSNIDKDGIYKGDLNQILDSLINNKIKESHFREPDLNNALTAVCFIADERVFNYDDYLDFIDYLTDVKMYPQSKAQMELNGSLSMLKRKSYENLKILFPEYFDTWTKDIMGDEKNIFLRGLLKGKKLA